MSRSTYFIVCNTIQVETINFIEFVSLILFKSKNIINLPGIRFCVVMFQSIA